MECALIQELISAKLDGESSAQLDAVIAEHLPDCPTCTRFDESATDIQRRLLHASPPLPDLAGSVMTSASRTHRLGVRFALGWAGVLMVIWNSFSVLGLDDAAAGHIGRHQGLVGVALGVSFLYAAWRPEAARGLIPFGVVFAGLVIVTTTVDIIIGEVQPLEETRHLVEIVGIVMLWLTARIGPVEKQGPPRRGRLHPVD